MGIFSFNYLALFTRFNIYFFKGMGLRVSFDADDLFVVAIGRLHAGPGTVPQGNPKDAGRTRRQVGVVHRIERMDRRHRNPDVPRQTLWRTFNYRDYS